MKQTVLFKLLLFVIAVVFSTTAMAQMPWSYVNTGANHTVLIQTAPIVSGNPIATGDFIGVFFLDNGVEVCGGYVEYPGTSTAIAAMGDDSTTPGKDGFNNNEAFIWKVWRASDGQVIPMTTTYMVGFPNEGLYSTNGMSGILSMTGTAVILPFAVTGVVTNVSCFGGNNGLVNITPTGGVPPYNYTWSNGSTTQDISGVTAGTYTVTVKDNSVPSPTFSWNYINTGANHTVLIQTAPIVNGSALSVGDAIGVFFTSGANQVCGGYVIWDGVTIPTALAAMGDDSTTPEKDGFANNESFIWKVWKASDGGVANMTASYMPFFPNTNLYSTNGMSGVDAMSGTYQAAVANGDTLTFTVTQPADLVVTNQITAVSCFGGSNGSIALTVSGGVAPYTYLWSNAATTATISALAAGAYSVTVTDANLCQEVLNLSVTQPTSGMNLTAVLSAYGTYQVSVFGGTNGSVDLSVAGGTAPFAYVWSNAATTQDLSALAAGTYSVTVSDANACTATASFTLTQPLAISVAHAITDVTCAGGNNGAVAISVSGGISPYTYLWSNGATTATASNLVAGNYSVTVTDAFGATTVKYYTVADGYELAFNLPADETVCLGNSFTVQAGSFSSYSWSTGASTSSITVSAAGTYSCVVTDANGCIAIDEFVLSTWALPVVNLGNDAAICDGTSYTLNAGVFTGYQWSNGENTQTIQVGEAGMYSVTVTDANGCEGSDNFDLTVNALPQVNLGADAQICEGDDYLFNAGSFNAYLWSGGQTTPSILVSTAGNYSVTVTDANNCQGSDVVNLSFFVVTPVNLGADAAICAGNSYTLNAGTYSTYQWSTGATTSSISVSSAGTYNVLATDANGCESQDSFTLTVNNLPVADLGNDAAICSGDSYLLDAGVFTAYLWSTGATTQTISVSAAGTYTVTVTDANGCQDNDDFTLTVFDLPVVTLDADAMVCEGDSYTLNGGSFTSYAWSTMETTSSIVVSAAGTYTLTATDGNGCENSDSFVLSYYPQPSVDLGPDSEICADGSFTLNAGTFEAYTWSTQETTASISVNSAGTYHVTVTDANGCEAHDSFVLTVNALPIVDLGPDAAICLGDSYMLDAGSFAAFAWSTGASTQTLSVSNAGDYMVTVTDLNGCQNSDAFTLSVNALPVVTLIPDAQICEGDDLLLHAGTFSAYEWSTGASSHMIVVSTAGTYTVTVTDGNGCENSDSFVLSYYPQPSVDLGPDSEICADGSFTLNAGTFEAYTWSTQETTASININAAGTYHVTVTDANGCEAHDSFVLSVNALPIVDLGVDAAICIGDSYLLDAGAFAAYSWSTGATTQTISVSTAGDYFVTVTDLNGCQNSDAFTLTVNALPIVDLGPDQNFCIGQPAILDAGVFAAYEWSTGATTQTISVNSNGNYAVTVTDMNGCEGSDNVNLLPATPFELGANGFICSGETYTFDAGTAFDSYVWSNGATTSSIEVATAGTYGVTVSVGGCSVSDFATLTVYSLPVVNLGGNTAICENEVLTLNAGTFTSYSWSTGATTSSIDVNTAGTYGLTVTNIHGCENSDAMVLTINTLPVVSLGADQTICANEMVTLNGGTFAAYSWSTGATTATIDVNIANTYTVTVTDGNGCENSDAMVLTVNPLPIVSLGADQTICADEIVTLNAGTFAAYSWSTGATTATIDVNTTNTYSVTVTDGNGCENSDAMVLTVNALPIVSVGADQTICADEMVTLNAGTFAAYSWSTGATTATIDVNTANTYAVTVTDGNGCENSDAMVLMVNPLPIVSLGADQTICADEMVTLNAGTFAAYSWSTGATTATINVNTTNTYSVTVTDGNGCENSDAMVLTVNVLPIVSLGADQTICANEMVTLNAGTFAAYSWSTGATTATIDVNSANTYAVTVTDGNGCENSDAMVLTVNPLPVVSVGADQTICANEMVTLNAGTFAGYSWSTGATTATIDVNLANTYTVTVTDGNGCENSDAMVLTVNPLPIVSLGADQTICADDMVTLNAGTFAAYSWSTGASASSIMVNTSGTYSVTVTDGNGCENSDAMVLTVNPLPIVSLGADQTICADEMVTLNAGTFAAYSWSTGATTATIDVNTANTYAVTVTDGNGCENSDAMVLTVNPLPIVSLGADQTICADEMVTLNAGTFAAYSWSTGATTATINVNTTNTYSVTVTDGNGCENSDAMVLTVNALPIVSLGADQTICANEMVTLNAGTFAAYSWSTGATTATIDVNTANTYAVTVTDGNGCENSDAMVLTVNPLPVVSVGADQTICANEMVTLNAGTFAAYSWSTGATTATIDVNTANTYTVTVTDGNGCENSDAMVLTVNALPVVNLGADQTICADDMVTLNAGTFAAYSWSTGATTATIDVNTSNTYSVTVTDGNGCENSDAMVLTVNALPLVDLGADQTICADDMVTLNAGTFAAYSWSTGATTATIDVNTADTYAVTVTDGNGCENSDAMVLTVNALPVVELGNDTLICNGSVLTLDAGSFAAYLWSDASTAQTLDVNAAGTYAVTVTDGNGCQSGDEIMVELSIVIVLPSEYAICEGDIAVLGATGFSGYVWSNGSTTATIEVGTGGTYSVTVTDANSCESSASILLIVNPLPVVDFGADTLEFAEGSFVTLNPGTFAAYSWSTGVNTATINASTEGTYSVTVTDDNGCAGSGSVWVQMQIGIQSPELESAVTIYPNPASGILNISSNDYQIQQVVVYNSLGEVILMKKEFTSIRSIDVSSLSNGMYFLQIISTDQQTAMKAFKVLK